ncbi:MAG: carbohydrate binding family 9 domain-containing protein [Myxococcales bacterium]|nr:carbohydrate binding family 9 domain-containing protein [Myxococcales bacterium]
MTIRILLALLVLASPAIAAADDSAAPARDRSTRAVRKSGAITVDGHLDDAGWRDVPVASDFWQRSPKEGAPPGHATEFQIAYDDRALYVAVRAHDDQPDAIRRLLHRRDQESSADWVGVMIDSYHDRRTAFGFALNAAGVQRDVLMYDDTSEDGSWDAVWAGASAVDARGWTAEFRIPLGQLRFAEDDQPWGVQVMRFVGRTGEQDMWSPSPRNEPGFVSRFGALEGVRGLRGGRRIELLPYVTGGLGRAPHDAGDPFHDAVDPRIGVGLDAKLGLTSAVTAAVTINPDFGQVEADPSQVNLTANETYFAEKRPFFVEGTEIFQVGLGQGDGPGSTDTLFYSRRIGAAPYGDIDGVYTEVPTGTTIYGAAKISGKTAGGWSFGVLDAVTAEERAAAVDEAGQRRHAVVEPLTNYGLVRLKKDLRAGATTVGAAVTSVTRRLDGTGLEDELHDQAVTGGLQLSHRFRDDTWNLGVRTFGSWVHGSADAITATQTDFRHLYQRPDADHLAVDPTRTSLSGAGVVWDLGKVGGKHWRYGVGGDVRTAGFEANDLGFHGPVDGAVQFAYGSYQDNEPGDDVLSWRVNTNAWVYGNTAPELFGYGGNVNGHVQFTSFWDVFGGVGLDNNMIDAGGTRGGPALRTDPVGHVFGGVSSDGRKRVSFSANFGLHRNWAADDWNSGFEGGLNVQARSNIEVFVGPTFATGATHDQFVEEAVDDAGASHYVFGRIEQNTAALTVRGAWTFTPHLSLQFYAQPFVATGAYRELKQAGATRAAAHDARYLPYRADQLTRMDDVYFVDQDRDGAPEYAFGVPDFDVREVRSTFVLRWEFRPGSSAFVIWSHGQSDSVTDGRFALGRDLAALVRAPSDDVVMVKANYWLGL